MSEHLFDLFRLELLADLAPEYLLKNIAQKEHSRHRSFNNFIVNILSAIAAYCFFPPKPSVDIAFVDDAQMVLF